MTKKIFALAITACSLLVTTGCVRTSTTMLDSRTAIISGKGSAFDSHAGVAQATLVEAANLTIQNGYRYFVITGSQDRTRRGMLYSPGQSQTTGTLSGTTTTMGNMQTVNGSYSSNTITSPGTVTPLEKPGMDVEVKMFKVGEINPKKVEGVWDAEDVLAVNKPK